MLILPLNTLHYWPIMFDFNHFLSFAVHGGQGGHGGGVAGNVEQLLAFLESLAEKSPEQIFTTLMPGLGSLENLHPLVVHYPIAFLSIFVLLDLFGSLFNWAAGRQAASWFLYIGALTAAITVAAGLAAAASVAHGDNVHDIMSQHQRMGISTLVLASLLSLWRFLQRGMVTGGANVLHQILNVILLASLILTADLGGLMVYQYGVAVETTESSMSDYFHEHQHSH